MVIRLLQKGSLHNSKVRLWKQSEKTTEIFAERRQNIGVVLVKFNNFLCFFAILCRQGGNCVIYFR